MFDFRRQSGRSGQGGYDEIIAKAWRAKHGEDPPTNYGDLEWIRFRAAYVTRFMREVRSVLDSVQPRRRLIASIPNAGPDPERALRASFTDWPTWLEEGLLDGLAVSELPIAQNDGFEGVCRAMQAIHKRVAGRSKVYWPLKWYSNWTLNLAMASGMSLHDCLREYTKRAWEAGAAGFVVDTYDYQMAGLDAKTQAVLADLFVNRYPKMKPGQVGTPRRVAAELPRPYTIPKGEDEPGLRQLTEGPGNDDEPAWSPDGKQIAFQSDRSGSLDVWVVPADGGQPRRLTDSPTNDCFPAWSPDGSQVAFASDRDGGFYHVFVMNRDGDGAKQLSAGPHQDFLPAWSSDGRRILFTSTRAKGSYDCSVWQVPVDGGEPEPVLGPAQGGYLMSVEGGLDPGSDVLTCSLVTSNMDNWILAAYPLGDPQPEEVIELTANKHSCCAPALDPTGQVVAFTGNLKGAWDLYALRLGSAEPLRLTQHPANDANPCWSPAGTRVVFASNRSGTYKLYTLPIPKIPDGGSAAKWSQRVAKLRQRTRRTAQERPYLDVAHGPEHRNSVASAGYGHLVGQSFVPTRSGELLKLRLNMTHDALDRPLTVMLREDAKGKPEGAVLAQTNVPRDAFEPTPRYGWAEVRFEQPPRLEKGRIYWIYMPQSGRYHWAIDTHNGYQHGRAFSDTYGYAGYDWIFEVYVK
jgi:WD40 repeat protein